MEQKVWSRVVALPFQMQGEKSGGGGWDKFSTAGLKVHPSDREQNQREIRNLILLLVRLVVALTAPGRASERGCPRTCPGLRSSRQRSQKPGLLVSMATKRLLEDVPLQSPELHPFTQSRCCPSQSKYNSENSIPHLVHTRYCEISVSIPCVCCFSGHFAPVPHEK